MQNLKELLTLLIGLVSLAIQTIPAVSVTNCGISSFELCLTTIREVTTDPNLAFPITRDELNVACRKLKEGDTCANNHMNNCTKQIQKVLFSDIVRGTQTVLGWLCVPGQYQNDYLRYSKCFRDVSLSEHKCLPVIRKVQSIDKDLRLVSDIDTELKTFCCSMKESVDCQLLFVRRDCGQSAAHFLDNYLKEISSQLMADHCATYTHSDGCAANVDNHDYSYYHNCVNKTLIIATIIICIMLI